MKVNIYPPPIHRLDKIDYYIKIKLDDYLRESKKLSRNAFDKVSFMKMFFNTELEQAKILLSEVGNSNSVHKTDPYSMSFARSGYGYSKDPETIHVEKEFFKFYIISLEKHLQVLTESVKVGAVKIEQLKKEMHSNIFVGNSFELWEYYKEVKKLTFQDRTDLRLLFELMKNDNLINETFELKHYIKWLNRFYFHGNITELKRVALKANKNVARTNDYNEYKKVTLK